MPFLAIAVPFLLNNWRVLLLLGLVSGIAGWAVYERNTLIQKGRDEATQQIEQANQEELNRAKAAQTTVDGCYATGGSWDRANGVCVQPSR